MYEDRQSKEPNGVIETPQSTADAKSKATHPSFGLSSKLLLLTVLFVMLSEVLIFVPSISKFRADWLSRKLELAEVAALIYTKSSNDLMDEALEDELLERLAVQTLALRTEGSRRLLAMVDMPGQIARDDDIRAMSPSQSIMAAFDTLLWGEGRTIRVVGQSQNDLGVIELVFEETPLRQAMVSFSVNILLLSIVISAITAGLVYLSLRALLVRPILRLLHNMAGFTSNPEDASAVIKPSGRRDEIGMTEEQLSVMEMILAKTLQKQRRLADLGLAVSKINHDLRNILASAQLFSDRLSMLEDPTVQRVVPKIMGALDRAVDYSSAVLSYGKAQEAPPQKRLLMLHQLGDEVSDFLDLGDGSQVSFINQIPDQLEVYADPGQLFRVLMNLCRNAVQVMQNETEDAVIRRLELTASNNKTETVIGISDTGPGVPKMAKEALFMPFQGSVRQGGTGLGLAISAELVRAHGGSICLLDRAPGAHFEIRIPKGNALSIE
ncbi:ATP-binding protein [Cohaesibacter celericrescens]|uniref:histidine kinase n=1 Tax=Cohaesibacter celericrescens TaxID=2067669 RepID=A0A2N5XNR3_9HYPH|nr:HAMP domain-containing sensor histidine kinase [Cohaesibacter celericrescens]PLW76144.1 histidine kinase [Cohaesibacter celericrescens]